MKLHNLSKVTAKTKKRLGRGIGSGKGKTAGRGTKGQKARGKIPAAAVGGGLILYKKLPFRRGWGNRKVSAKPILVTLDKLSIFRSGSTVNLLSLIEKGLVSEKEVRQRGVKILAKGELSTQLKIALPVSKSVKAIVEKMGGEVVF